MNINLNQMMEPFWKSGMMYDESVMMISYKGQLPQARLLFPPEKILSVTTADHGREFEEGVDWCFEDGLLNLTKNSRIPFTDECEMYPKAAEEGWTQPAKAGGYVLFHEEHFFHDRQLAVTYKHGMNHWKGPIPCHAGDMLPRTHGRLRGKKNVNLILYGDSIAVGANASGVKGAPPFLPNWGQLFTMILEQTYGVPVTFKNPSVGGKTSFWGAENVKTLVADCKPDLVILAFGMNDGSANTDKYIFQKNIRTQIECIREQNSETEFILVAPTLANPETFFAGCQSDYRTVLEELTCTGIVMTDMTSIHEELLKIKKFQDLTGNNINHPNDFLVRWYAQAIAALLLP